MLARPERFDLPTPWFVVGPVIYGALKINALRCSPSYLRSHSKPDKAKKSNAQLQHGYALRFDLQLRTSPLFDCELDRRRGPELTREAGEISIERLDVR